MVIAMKQSIETGAWVELPMKGALQKQKGQAKCLSLFVLRHHEAAAFGLRNLIAVFFGGVEP